ncbi:unnamed protein product [Discosporangium mesarthrocarpum]
MWDLGLFLILSMLVMIGFVAYGEDASRVFIQYWDSALGCWALLVLYGASSLPLSYLYSFAFDGPSTAQISISGINFLTGFGFAVAYAVLANIAKTAALAENLKHFFRFFPPYLLGDGLLKLSGEYYRRKVLGGSRGSGVFGWDVAGREMVFMIAEAMGYFFLVLLVEYSLDAGVISWLDNARLCLNGWKSSDLAAMLRESEGVTEDSDVREERLMVGMLAAGSGRAGARENGVLIQRLCKVYPSPMSLTFRGQGRVKPKCAVRGLSLSVRRGECFGLLGINGAGKSTTLQVLTRDLQATSGQVSVAGEPITSRAVCRLLGYCPQTDPLLPLMTSEETLQLFGGLKGLGNTSDLHKRRTTGHSTRVQRGLAGHVESALGAVGLGGSAKCLAGTLSGGNKRKLSLAVALIGNPPILLLDEPSSGMDPGARRSMWEVISSCSSSRSVVLTTHSMDECEALCDRVGIMVGGRFRCLGTCQHLKSRFGGGYTIEVRRSKQGRGKDQTCVVLPHPWRGSPSLCVACRPCQGWKNSTRHWPSLVFQGSMMCVWRVRVTRCRMPRKILVTGEEEWQVGSVDSALHRHSSSSSPGGMSFRFGITASARPHLRLSLSASPKIRKRRRRVCLVWPIMGVGNMKRMWLMMTLSKGCWAIE